MKKTVGGVPYTLVDKADTSNYNCLSHCVYKKDGNPEEGRFCFKAGIFEVICNEDSTSSLSTNEPLLDTTTMSIVIAGGLSKAGETGSVLKSTEECVCTTECTCKICPNADIPGEGRYSFTLDTLVFGVHLPSLCGGGNTDASKKSCLQLIGGRWGCEATLNEPRIGHSSMSSQFDLLVMGGSDSPKTAEVVDKGPAFSLDRNIFNACDILDDSCFLFPGVDSCIIITGGGDSLTTVSVYTQISPGQLGNTLYTGPSLLVGRKQHGCGSYQDGSDMILVVAGGRDKDNTILSSTETFKLGTNAWTPANPLPRAMYGMASVSIEQGVIILGGQDNAKAVSTEILAYKGETWKPFGNLKTARTLAAATKIISSTVCD